VVASCSAVISENTVISDVMGKIFDMSLKLMTLSHLQFFVILVDALLTALFIHIVMHDELVINASVCFSQ